MSNDSNEATKISCPCCAAVISPDGKQLFEQSPTLKTLEKQIKALEREETPAPKPAPRSRAPRPAPAPAPAAPANPAPAAPAPSSEEKENAKRESGGWLSRRRG